jgi:DnaJ-class molecular chaperone
MRIIAEQLEGYWSALQKSHPETALGGSDAEVAVKRRCTTIGVNTVDRTECRADHLEFVVGKPCSDCGGSGQYVGLNTVEACGTCAGSG